ncbi:MAG: hypothetical protein IT379_29570 [Deltaproteobacteria bacterium]|nr:hypothetical protein [Deltaproteobacteria bacterium]
MRPSSRPRVLLFCTPRHDSEKKGTRCRRQAVLAVLDRTSGIAHRTSGTHAVALHVMHYNFCRIHRTLRVTPAMACGLADHVWEISDLVALIPEPTVAAWGSRRAG